MTARRFFLVSRAGITSESLGEMMGQSAVQHWGVGFLVVVAAVGCRNAPIRTASPDGGSAAKAGDATTTTDITDDGSTATGTTGGADADGDHVVVVFLKQVGDACASAGECASGFCADGVCCSSACTENCKTCAEPSSLGECAYVPSGAVPREASDCPASAPSTCGLDGTCNGAGSCRLYPGGTQCASSSCQDNLVTSLSLCNGEGACTPATMACDPYACNPASGTCFMACTSDAQCMDGILCTNGSCLPKMTMPCSLGDDCTSGFCVDGICCSVACSGPCESCGLVGSIGICAPVAAGAPDPHGICRSDMASTCGQTGLCDGTGSCDLYPGGTACAAGSCSDGVLTPASVCNGIGACVTGPKMSCSPFACNPATGNCFNACASNTQCEDGIPCTSGSCSNNVTMPCSVNDECASGFCANGVCCDSACDGACESCNQPRTTGQCTPLPNPDAGLGCEAPVDADVD